MNQYLLEFKSWYDTLKKVPQNNGPAKGTIAASLVVLESLKKNYILDINCHTASSGTQIKGASGQAVKLLLAIFGETRPFVSEGGRTNRGLKSEIESLLQMLQGLRLDLISSEERTEALQQMQHFLVARIQDFHNRERVKFSFDSMQSTWSTVQTILEAARKDGKAGPVAQHLVGAKLELRFPESTIQNESYTTADVQTGRSGDFLVGDTVIHVTVAPMPSVYEKCNGNIKSGYRVYLLVSDNRLAAARQNALDICGSRVAVESIESFVSQNIEELGLFGRSTIQNRLATLLQAYNRRVNEVEMDKSLLIDVPQNLLP